jgi:hypothetical protein
MGCGWSLNDMSLLRTGTIAHYIADTGYHYGYPAYGPSEPNVSAQWLFDESSGNLIDEVASLALTPTLAGTSGTFTYGVNNIDYGSGLNPGLTINSPAPSQTAYLYNAAGTGLGLGTSDATIEWVSDFLATGSQAGTQVHLYTSSLNSWEHGMNIYYDTITTTPKLGLVMYASDGTNVWASFTLTSSVFGAGTKKHRLVLDRSGNAEYFIDGSSQGTYAISSLDGKTMEVNQFTLGAFGSNGANPINGTFYEFRQSANATNNSGGPGGG